MIMLYSEWILHLFSISALLRILLIKEINFQLNRKIVNITFN